MTTTCPRQNRVQPTGDILRHPTRGSLMGNRGILHDTSAHSHGALTHRRWQHKAWVCCVLSFKGRRRTLMAANRYTELFFHDEAVALAAGHRPCAECRRADHKAYLAAAGHTGSAPAFDKHLHAARAIPRKFEQNRAQMDAQNLPDATFVLLFDQPALLIGDMALPFTPEGYAAPIKRPQGRVTVLTPAPSITALLGGFRPSLRLPANLR
ncbi:hypothetical protein [Shimia sp. MMG029]|uniref:hypothetical protein n=1 Tax=Shimia sp. MMG029 TaxID=3021978 RepID=UPI0022FE6EA7|nr:hypothetical protein [Shimia sp. MMG029]MDA5555430.1 hypothetical protein [Shimia sp. MMG029]